MYASQAAVERPNIEWFSMLENIIIIVVLPLLVKLRSAGAILKTVGGRGWSAVQVPSAFFS